MDPLERSFLLGLQISNQALCHCDKSSQALELDVLFSWKHLGSNTLCFFHTLIALQYLYERDYSLCKNRSQCIHMYYTYETQTILQSSILDEIC